MEFLLNSSSNSTAPPLNLGGHRGANVDITSLWALITSVSTFGDWAKLLVLGGVLETGRRYLWRAWAYLISFFFLEAQLEATEPSYRKFVINAVISTLTRRFDQRMDVNLAIRKACMV